MTDRRPRLAIVAAALLLGFGTASCSDDSSDKSDDKPTAAASEKSNERVAPEGLPEIPKLAKAKGAVGDLELADCEVDAGEQTVSGTIASTAKKVRDYVVTISWVNDSSDVRGRAVVVEKAVEPGAERDFEATADVAAGATQCVPNVRAGTLKKG